MWVEIFRTEKHTDSNGKEWDWTDEDLDRIISQYNPEEHEAPIVIGHPKHDSPAYGWVEALKREGKILKAKLKDLVPEFVDMVKRGLFKKRSIALYPNLSLKHVGFLGAIAPAVKGLRNVSFTEKKEFIMYEFNEKISAGERLHQKVEEFLESSGDLTYSQAFKVVCERNPALVKQYMEEAHAVKVKIIGGGEAGKELERKALEFMEAPNKIDQYGRKITGEITYGQAYKIICDKNPDLVKKLIEERRRDGIY